MTYQPGDMSQGEWVRFCEVNPRREGESRSDWLERLSLEAEGKRKSAPAGLPYREDREPGDDD